MGLYKGVAFVWIGLCVYEGVYLIDGRIVEKGFDS